MDTMWVSELRSLRVTFTLLVFCLVFSAGASIAQKRKSSKQNPVRTLALHKVGEYPNRYTAGTFLIRNVVLEDVRPVQNGWPYVLQLYDPATRLRRGQEENGSPFHPHDFLICAPAGIGTALFKNKDRWRNRKVNVYLIMQDVGLTVFVYAGYVTKIEMLDDRGKVIETLAADS